MLGHECFSFTVCMNFVVVVVVVVVVVGIVVGIFPTSPITFLMVCRYTQTKLMS